MKQKKSLKKVPSSQVDFDEVKRKLNQGNMQVAQEIQKEKTKGPSKSQIQRLKKLYNTTRWLPNSAFTTYFGKPAFENYGYGNTNPVYGGLFYGNYMLSHNMNPIDGANHPPEKQVYSSAMMKSCQRKGIRRPSPPRKVPEEIRNTPEELQEIRTRKQIFQLPNNFPAREIIPPNLLKCRYFRSGKNTPNHSEEENEDEYEVWNVENVLSGKKNKVKKIKERNLGGNEKYNPYQQGKVQLGKKKMKEGLDNKIDEGLYQKVRDKKARRGEMGEDEKQNEEESDDEEFQKQKNFYEKMLGEDGMKNIEDLAELKLQTKEDAKEHEQEQEREEEEVKQPETFQDTTQDHQFSNTCPLCKCGPMTETGSSILKKKENPALYPPTFTGAVCCFHHTEDQFNLNQQNPRNFTNMPPCMLNSIVPAGKPMRRSAPLSLFG